MSILKKNIMKKNSIENNSNKSIWLLSISAFLLRAFYIFYTAITLRQHDIGSYEEQYGHLGYIAYLATHRLQLPDVDPRTIEQFYHPPLHHLISAIWVKFNMKLGFSDALAYENVQILTLIYAMLTLCIMYYIIKEFYFDKKITVILYMLLCFHPYFIILSGSANNDSLCILLILLTLYATLRWYREETYKWICVMAFSLALSMISKASGVFLAPAIAILFLIKLYEKRTVVWKFIKQYLLFGVISIPIGMSWCVYNYVKWKVPFNYIPIVGTDSEQYLGNISVIKRLLSFSFPIGKKVFVSLNASQEYKMWVTMLKESIFDEFCIASDIVGIIGANILFYINFILVLIVIGAVIFAVLVPQKNMKLPIKIVLFVYLITLMTMYFRFIFEYPYVCSMSMRYIVPAILIGILGVGFSLQRCINSTEKYRTFYYQVVRGISIAFCIMSGFEYVWIGIMYCIKK